MIRLLLRHRAIAALLLGSATALIAWSAASLRVDPGAEAMMPRSGADLERLRRFNATFGADEVIVLALHSDRLFSADHLHRIDELTQQLAELPHVAGVLSPTNVRDIDGDELGPFAVVPYRQVADGELDPEQMGRSLAAHPLLGGLLVSRDARAAALLIEVERVEGDAAYRRELVQSVRELAPAGVEGLTAHVAGIPVEKVDVAAHIRRDQMVLVPLVFLTMALIMTLLYRHPTGVLVPLTVMAVVLVWTLGLYALAGRALNPVTSLLGPVVLVVSLAGAVHFLNHHLGGLASGLDEEQALLRAFRRARVPCLSAALTTAIGFASLAMMPIPAIREFGLFTALGVMLSFPLTMLLVPLLLSWLPDFPRPVRDSFRPGRIERALRGVVRFSAHHRPWIAGLSVAVALVSVLGLVRLRIETDLIHALRASSPLYRATAFIDRNLTGVNSLEILVDGLSAEAPGDMRRLARFSRAVAELPGVRKLTGLPDLYARIHRAFNEGDDGFQRLPQGPGAADDLADIRELLIEEAPDELRRFLSPDGTLRLAGRAVALGTAASQALFRSIAETAAAQGLPEPELTGNFVALSNMSTELVRNQVRGLLPALGLILVAIAVQFRSLRVGLVCIVPAAAPVLIVYGLMGWLGVALSVPTAMIAGVTIGMTVDNTIHFVAAFRRGAREGGAAGQPLVLMVDAAGRAVVYAALIAAAGFCVGVFGSFLPTVHFAVFVGAALALGLVSMMVLLPLVLTLLEPPSEPRGRVNAVVRSTVALVCLGLTTVAVGEQILLEDQHGERYGPARFHGGTSLLFHGKPNELRKMKSWEVEILERIDRPVGVLRAIDARALEGKKSKREVAERLRKNVPKEVSILIDWTGRLAAAFALPDGLSVTVLDPNGRACASVGGTAARDRADATSEILRRMEERCASSPDGAKGRDAG